LLRFVVVFNVELGTLAEVQECFVLHELGDLPARLPHLLDVAQVVKRQLLPPELVTAGVAGAIYLCLWRLAGKTLSNGVTNRFVG
jgi:hypothetical protein